jgi:hypothetical protein
MPCMIPPSGGNGGQDSTSIGSQKRNLSFELIIAIVNAAGRFFVGASFKYEQDSPTRFPTKRASVVSTFVQFHFAQLDAFVHRKPMTRANHASINHLYLRFGGQAPP